MKAIGIVIVAAGLLVAGSAMATVSVIEMPAVAKKNNCTACHAIYKRVVGPAWLEVSKKYKGVAKFTYAEKEYPLLEGMMMKVSKGGSGSWGAMPMPANDAAGAKQAEIKELVTFVLGLEKAESDKSATKKPDAKK
jgi:cytochrome c551/c552